MTSLSRGRLLAGAAISVGLSLLAAQPAYAQGCTFVTTNVTNDTCDYATTTTTDTTYPTNAPLDRAYDWSFGFADPTFFNIATGEVADGFGLAVVQSDTSTNTFQFTNDGLIQVDAGNTPTAGGGSAALLLTANSGSIIYQGTGDINNLGTGAGLQISTVDGSITGNTSGDITAVTGRGLDVQTSGTGSIDFTSTGLISSDTVNGVWAEILSGTGGDLTLNLNDVTAEGSYYAVYAPSASDAGNVNVTTNGTLTGGGGISTGLSSGTATGDVTVTSNGDIVANDIGIVAYNSGSGDVTVTSVGPITATSNFGIDATANGGNVTVDAGAITAGTYGINATQTNAAGTGDIDVGVTGAIAAGTNGIVASNAGLGGVTVTTGAGAVTAAAGSAIIAENTNAASADPILVTVGTGGATGTGADAVIASTAGTGSVTVNSSGPIVSDTGNGITTSATTGLTDINITGGSVTGGTDGINATATTGTISVDLTGGADVTGVDDAVSVSSSGAKTVNIGAGSVVSGAYGVYGTGGGTLAVTNAGTLGTAGQVAVLTDLATTATITNQTGGVMNGRVDLSDGNDSVTNAGTWNLAGAQNFYLGTDTITNQAGGTITVAAGSSFNGLEALNNAGTLTAASGLLFDAGNTAVTNTGTMNVAGTLDFGAGTDSLANNGAGIFNLTGATTLTGLETFTNAGRINLNTFTLTGPAVAFTNTGTIDTNGSAGLAGFTAFSNGGTLDLAAGTFTVPAGVFTNTGTILADEGATTITGQTSFANSGTIDLQDGAVGDVLTINSAFVGSGGSTLALDFADTTADLLVINGAASGTTAVDANYVGTGLLNLAGVQVVDATTATAGAFVLGDVTGNTSPLVDYSLVQNGGDFFMVAAPTAALFDPLAITNMVTTMWYQSADEVLAETHKPATTVGFSFWGDVYWSRDKYGDNGDTVTVAGVPFEVDNRLKTKRKGVQMGADYGFGGGRIGATLGYAWAKPDNDGDFSDYGFKAKGWNLGAYGQFGGITGIHGEFLVKYDKYQGQFDSGAFDGQDVDFHEFGLDGSAGYRFGFGGSANLDASVGLSHVESNIDDIDAFGFSYDIGKVTSTRGRAGLRAVFGGSLAPYVDGTVYHEFNGNGNIDLFDGATTYDLETNGKATWFRLEGGLSGNDGPGPILAAWADLGDKKGFGLRAGWRLGGRLAEAAPPPPPPPVVAPPPPPPPATQTCPDGSVILATDACPPPPPPPPPPPQPERG